MYPSWKVLFLHIVLHLPWNQRKPQKLTLFLFVKMASDMHCKTCIYIIHIKTYWRNNILIVIIWLCTWYINTWTFCTTIQHTFPVWLCIIWWWIGTHCCHIHVILCFEHMLTMWHDIIFIYFKYRIGHFTWPSVFLITDLIFQFFK